MSIGVAAFPEHAHTPADLIQAADHALYRAKPAAEPTRMPVAAD